MGKDVMMALNNQRFPVASKYISTNSIQQDFRLGRALRPWSMCNARDPQIFDTMRAPPREDPEGLKWELGFPIFGLQKRDLGYWDCDTKIGMGKLAYAIVRTGK